MLSQHHGALSRSFIRVKNDQFCQTKSFKQIMQKGLNWISIQATIFQCFLAAQLEKTVSSLTKFVTFLVYVWQTFLNAYKITNIPSCR